MAALPAPTLFVAEGFKLRKFPRCKTCGSYTEHTASDSCRVAPGFRMGPYSKEERTLLGTAWDVDGVLYTVVSLAPKWGCGRGTEAFWAYSDAGVARRLVLDVEARGPRLLTASDPYRPDVAARMAAACGA